MADVPRIPVAWLVILILAGIAAFFAYHIFAASGGDPALPVPQGIPVVSQDPVIPYNKPSPPVFVSTQTVEPDMGQHGAELDVPVVPQPMPKVVGQTEADLRETRPIQQTPPSVEYADPVARDTSADPTYFESEFGDNLRHPEQTIEIHPPMGSMRTAVSGLGSDMPMPDPITRSGTQYSPELAQNGGEFMSGIMAFDGMDAGGIGFSSI